MKIKDNPYYLSDGISNSGLSLINPEQGGHPELYRAANLGLMEKKEHLSLERGRIVHLFALEEGSFKVADVERPSDGIAKVIEHLASVDKSCFIDSHIIAAADSVGFRTKWGTPARLNELKTFQTESYFEYLKLPEEYVIINSSEKTVIENSIKSIKSHPYAKLLIFGDEWDGYEVFNEIDLKAFDYNFQKTLKGLLDRLMFDHKNKTIIIPDLKTTSKPVDTFKYSYVDYRYYRQHAFYGNLVKLVYKDLIDKGYHIEYKSVVVNIQLNGFYSTRVFDIHPDYIEMGTKEYQNLLTRINYAETFGYEYPMEHWIQENQTGKLEFTIKP